MAYGARPMASSRPKRARASAIWRRSSPAIPRSTLNRCGTPGRPDSSRSGTMWSRVGGVTANPDNAYRLLREQNQLVLVFPEGTKGTSKTYAERYKLRRFGRGGRHGRSARIG